MMINETESLIQLIDKKWEKVKHYYEGVYKDPTSGKSIRFKKRPTDDQVEWLYDQMKRLGMTERIYQRER